MDMTLSEGRTWKYASLVLAIVLLLASGLFLLLPAEPPGQRAGSVTVPLNQDQRNYEQELDELAQTRDRLEAELVRSKAETAAREADVAARTADLATRDERIEALTLERTNLMTQITDLIAARQAVERRLDEVQLEKNQVTALLEQARAEQTEVDARLAEVEAERGRFANEIKGLRDQVASFSLQAGDLADLAKAEPEPQAPAQAAPEPQAPAQAAPEPQAPAQAAPEPQAPEQAAPASEALEAAETARPDEPIAAAEAGPAAERVDAVARLGDAIGEGPPAGGSPGRWELPLGRTVTSSEGPGNLDLPTSLPLTEESAPSPISGALARGVAQYNRGDYKLAFNIWYPLAEQGVRRAQFYVGSLFHEGRGVEGDPIKAYYWLSLSEKAGYAKAGPVLETVESVMTQAQIAAANKLLGTVKN